MSQCQLQNLLARLEKDIDYLAAKQINQIDDFSPEERIKARFTLENTMLTGAGLTAATLGQLAEEQNQIAASRDSLAVSLWVLMRKSQVRDRRDNELKELANGQ